MATTPTVAGSDAAKDVADPAIVRARLALLAEIDSPRIPLQTNAVLSATLTVRPLDAPLLDARAPNTPIPDTARVEISPPLTQARRTSHTRRKARRLSPTSLLAVTFAVLLYIGFTFPTERYITPRRGLGYALGIIGGSLMLLLLVYSARKRLRWLRFLGPTVGWFRTHMLLGVLGPLCILYHANFNLGAANSNVALFSMLAVSGSGLIGRYIYAHIHHGLYGSKLTLRELQQNAATLRSTSDAFAFLPELMSRLQAAETRVLAVAPRLPLLGIAKLLVVSAVVAGARFTLHRYTRRTLRTAAAGSVTQSRTVRKNVNQYVDRRLTAVRKVASFQAYERLFSLWHALHLPLIFILVAAAVVHVIAVNVY